MSNSGMKAFLKRSVSFLVTAAIVVISVSVSATVSDDYAKAFDAYYSADLKSTDPSAVNIQEQWEVSNSKLYRKSINDQWNSNTVKNVSLLYYNAREYYNFEMETEFSHVTNGDNLVAFFGFGAKKGSSWMNNKGDTALSVNPTHGAIINAKNEMWVSTVDERLAAQDKAYKMNDVHKLKIRMVEKSYTVWLDGYKVASGTNSSYTGGYIYFGSNAFKTYFAIPKITALHAMMNTEALTSYYTESIKENDTLDSADFADYWKLNSESTAAERTDKNTAALNDGNSNMAVLYATAAVYDNFESTFTLANRTAPTDKAVVFGFGGKDGENWRLTEGACAFAMTSDGELYEAVSGKKLTEKSAREVIKQKTGADNWGDTHEIKLNVFEKSYSVAVDGYEIFSGYAENYASGLLFVGASAAGVSAGAFEVKTIKSFSDFTAYRAASMKGDKKPEKSKLSSNWKLNENGTLESRGITGGAYALLINTADIYRDFELEIEYSAPSNMVSTGLAAFGFGGEAGSNLSDSGSFGYLLHSAGAVLNASNEAWITGNGKDAVSQAKAAGKTYTPAALHKLAVTVDSRKVTVKIDSYTVASFTVNESYKGGNLWFAAKADGVVFKSFTAKKLNVFDTNIMRPYHTNNVTDSEFYPESQLDKYWKKINYDTALSRVTDKDGNTNSNVAILYYGTDNYSNVEMTAIYENDGTKRYVTFFGAGAAAGTTWMNNDSDIAFAVNGNGKLLNLKTGVEYPEASAKAQCTAENKTWDGTASHKFTVRVTGDSYTVKIDGYTVGTGTNESYGGGCVYVGSSANGVVFSKVAAVGLLDQTKFTPYYTSNVKNAADGKTTLEKEEFSKRWSVNSAGRAQRNFEGCTWGEDVDSTMSVLYYNVKEYKSFDMTVEYATVKGYGDWVAFFGFGGTQGKSWKAADNKGDTPFIIHAGGLLLNAKNKSFYPGTAVSDAVNKDKGAGAWNAEGVHTLHVKVDGTSFTIWIDGYKVTSGTNADYTGGYIYFAANAGSVQFGEPVIKELLDTSCYDAYYTETLTKDDLEKVELGDKWSVTSDGLTLSRKDGKDANPGNNEYKHLSVIYYNKAKYKNFDMTVEYAALENMDDFSCFVGFGASKPGKSWLAESGQQSFLIHSGGGILNPTNLFWYDGTPVSDQVYADKGAGYWKTGGIHTLRVRSEDNYFTIWIDGYLFTEAANTKYTGGYIYFASNAQGVRFGQPSIIPLDEEEDYFDPDYRDYGWQPTAEDAYFDFTQKRTGAENIHKYTPVTVD